MTFQRRTALQIIALVQRERPDALVVVGGYDPSLAPEVWETPDSGVDVVVSGEGDITFRELLRTLERQGDLADVAGLSFRRGRGFVRTTARAVSELDAEVRPPKRSARVLSGYTMLGRPIDIVETSRGCTYDCSFCSIIEMRGRNFHTWSIERVIDDIRDAQARGARSIFLVDDNITLNVARFRLLCQAIVEAGLDRIDYLVQGMTSAFVSGGDDLARLMRAAGFRYVFLGIENVIAEDLSFLRATAKNAERQAGRTVGNATTHAVAMLHRHGLLVVGGLIVGNPGDTREAIEANLAFARRYVDWPYIQHPTPYPGTPMTTAFREKGLIVSDNVEEYDGTTAVVRTGHLEAEEVEFMRWRAERWMKVRHLPKVIAHDPGFVARSRRADVAPHLPWHDAADVAGTGVRADGVRALQGDSPPRASVLSDRRLAGRRSRSQRSRLLSILSWSQRRSVTGCPGLSDGAARRAVRVLSFPPSPSMSRADSPSRRCSDRPGPRLSRRRCSRGLFPRRRPSGCSSGCR